MKEGTGSIHSFTFYQRKMNQMALSPLVEYFNGRKKREKLSLQTFKFSPKLNAIDMEQTLRLSVY